ncbi:MAG TPA: aldehyde dehydrogenase family protein [Caulobacteraceae bacterium]|nr:aldehyde dehydrogenase family protein [Caulobacteraceae bacterium]
MTEPLERLEPGMPIPFGGDRLARVGKELAAAFRSGDRLLVIQDSGELLRIPGDVWRVASDAVDAAAVALAALAATTDDQIARFFELFAGRLGDDALWAGIAGANAADLASARDRGRPTGRLAVSDKMRADMIAGLLAWRDLPPSRGRTLERSARDGFSIEQVSAALGVVGFVFEGRPNVVADAAGVLRGGNAAVLRIGADALGTARAVFKDAIEPALADAGLPEGALILLDNPEHAAAWALFSDSRLALAVARGSGAATTLLGSIARQAGAPASLHGTGGAWLIADRSADGERFANAVSASLDRKVCNTLNVCLIERSRATDLLPRFLGAFASAGGRKLHVAQADIRCLGAQGPEIEPLAEADLGREWEWDEAPEASLRTVGDLDEAISLFNRFSPRLAASLISEDPAAHERFWRDLEAPFVGDGMTRWVDGQYALGKPELGLSNWQAGRLLARSAVLTGGDVFTVRTRMRQSDIGLRR